jgi:hypothetical protein
MRWRSLRFGPEDLTSTPVPESGSVSLPNRSPEADLNLPPDTLPEWNMRPSIR